MPYVLRRERLGIEKGIEIGRLETLRWVVVDNLEARFANVPSGIVEQINALDDQVRLRALGKLAVTSETLEAFEAQADL